MQMSVHIGSRREDEIGVQMSRSFRFLYN